MQFLKDILPDGHCSSHWHFRVAICHEIFRDLLRLAPRTREKRLEVHAHADVVTLLLDAKRTVLEEIEEVTKKKVSAKVEVGFHQEKYEITPL